MALAKPIATILKEANDQTDEFQRVEYLRKNGNAAVQLIIKAALEKAIEWQLPPGEPPYKPCQWTDQEGRLHAEARRLYLFVNDPRSPQMKPSKREALFIDILESVPVEDAKLLIAIKDKKWNYPNITPQLVNQIWENLIIDPIEVDIPKPVKKERKARAKKKDVPVEA